MNLPLLLLQIGIILIASRLIGGLFRRVHQPQAVGEMLAGILLGPSLLGTLLPNVSAALFPPASLNTLSALSQIGLIVFMFMVGLELDPQVLRGRGHVAIVTSHVSIIVPFVLGALLAVALYPMLGLANVPMIHFALFIGTAMSITAFPVLARILAERDMLHTHVGTIAIACAAVDDVTAWCILAGVVLLVRASDAATPLWLTVLGSLTFVGVMIFGVRQALRGLEVIYRKHRVITQDTLALILLLVLASALITESLGVHALFGAFLIGAIMPKQHDFVEALTSKMNDITVVLLLPLFFAFTGLRTSIGLLNGAGLWAACAMIIGVAIVGKFGGSTLASRVFGMSWREAGVLGILMNTRGLVELVALNIGLDIGVISPTVFTMMVIMALVTTLVTSPLLQWLYPAQYYKEESSPASIAVSTTTP
jgi:Kef-type K+ transport system membrane component KefB